MKKLVLTVLVAALCVTGFVFADDRKENQFTASLWIYNNDTGWGWLRLTNGLWKIVMPESNGYMINDMKISYRQRGKVLYINNGNNSDNEPAGRIKEETAAYIVVQWYEVSGLKEEKMKRVLYPVNIYYTDYDKGTKNYLGLLNAIGDE